MSTTGKLNVRVLEARLLRDTETFGKMDVYCLFNTRMQRVRTKTCRSGGKEPSWNGEEFVVDVKYIGDDMTIQCLDEDPCKSDLIGETIIKLSSLAIPGGLDDWFVIQYHGKEAGKIHLTGEWHPSDEALLPIT